MSKEVLNTPGTNNVLSNTIVLIIKQTLKDSMASTKEAREEWEWNHTKTLNKLSDKITDIALLLQNLSIKIDSLPKSKAERRREKLAEGEVASTPLAHKTHVKATSYDYRKVQVKLCFPKCAEEQFPDCADFTRFKECYDEADIGALLAVLSDELTMIRGYFTKTSLNAEEFASLRSMLNVILKSPLTNKNADGPRKRFLSILTAISDHTGIRYVGKHHRHALQYQRSADYLADALFESIFGGKDRVRWQAPSSMEEDYVVEYKLTFASEESNSVKGLLLHNVHTQLKYMHNNGKNSATQSGAYTTPSSKHVNQVLEADTVLKLQTDVWEVGPSVTARNENHMHRLGDTSILIEEDAESDNSTTCFVMQGGVKRITAPGHGGFLAYPAPLSASSNSSLSSGVPSLPFRATSSRCKNKTDGEAMESVPQKACRSDSVVATASKKQTSASSEQQGASTSLPKAANDPLDASAAKKRKGARAQAERAQKR